MSLEIINFKSEYAQKYGMLEAVIIWQLHFYLTHAKSNKQKYHDNKYWTFNSVKAWQEQLPFATYKQIKDALYKLRKLGIVIVGNFNKKKYDKTLWYSLSDEFFKHTLVPTGTNHCPSKDNGESLEGQPIPKVSTKVSTKVVEVEEKTTHATTSNEFKTIKEYILSTPYYRRLKAPGMIKRICEHFGSIDVLNLAYHRLYSSYQRKKPFNSNFSDAEENNWYTDCYEYIENSLIKEIKK